MRCTQVEGVSQLQRLLVLDLADNRVARLDAAQLPPSLRILKVRPPALHQLHQLPLRLTAWR